MAVRPINSAGKETIQMPELSSLPDTSPVNMSIWLNRSLNSLAHFHNNGTQVAPTYLSDGGMWARPLEDGVQNLLRLGGVDREAWALTPNGIHLPFGYTRQMGSVTNLNSLITEGLYHFTSGTTNAPGGISSGNVWVQRSRRSASQTYYQQMVLGDNSVFAYRTGVLAGTSTSWGDWRFLQYETAVPAVISGAILNFSGSFGGQSNRFPINPMTNQTDTSFALCDGATHTTSDGRSVTTPNLVNRFIKGSTAAGAKVTGGGGGSVSVSIGATTLTTAQMPAHSHTLPRYYLFRADPGSSESGGEYVLSDRQRDMAGDITTSTGGGTSHTHSASGTLSNIEPAYYTLAFIMKL